MPERVPQSVALTVPLQAYLSSDHVSPATGKTLAITISKGTGAYGNPSAGATNATEIANGSYYVSLSTTDTGTTGPLFVVGTASGVDQVVAIYDVVNPHNAGFDALPATSCTTNASVLTSGTGTDQLSVSSGKVILQATQTGVTIPTVTTVTNQLTAAAIATGVWQDATAGDFTTSSSIGKSLYNSFTAGTSVFTTAALANAPTGGSAPTVAQIATAVWEDTTAGGDFGTSGSIGKLIATTGLTVLAVTNGVTVTTNNDKTGYSLATAPPTAAAVATAVWQDATAGDFTTASSIGKSLYNAFTSNTSVYTTAALANAPTGGSAPTAAQIATAVWEDTTAGGDFGTSGSIGKLIATTGLTVLAVTNGVTVTTNNDKSGYSLATAPPTAATIATAVWQDATAGDFTTASSIGKSLYNAFTSNTSVYTTAALANAPTGGSAPTAAQIATAVWTDTTAGDFTTSTSPGKIIFTQLGGAFTTSSSSVYSTASLANAPTGGSAPTTAQIATAVWQDLTSGSDFGTAGSVGAVVKANLDTNVGSRSTYAGGAVASVTGNVGGNVVGSVASVTAPVSILGTQTLAAARPLDAIADTSLTLNDVFHCAIAAAAGKESVVGTAFTVKTPSTGTTLRTFTLDSGTAPTQRS